MILSALILVGLMAEVLSSAVGLLGGTFDLIPDLCFILAGLGLILIGVGMMAPVRRL